MERDVKRIRRVWNKLIWIVVGKGQEKLHQRINMHMRVSWGCSSLDMIHRSITNPRDTGHDHFESWKNS